MKRKTNRPYTPQVVSQIPAIRLQKVWRVDEDGSFFVTKTWFDESDLIMVRTHTGGGVFGFIDGTFITVPAWSFVILRTREIATYRTAGNAWKFWWFQVDIAGEFEIQLRRVFMAAKLPDEPQRISHLCEMLIGGGRMRCSAAAAMLMEMMCEWCGQLDAENISETDDFIRKADAVFRRDMSHPLSVESVADEFGMSSRWFRRKFIDASGIPPKQYYDRMRLEMAKDMLRMKLASISELSEQLGYSSVYHFSRAFRKHFGTPPSKI